MNIHAEARMCFEKGSTAITWLLLACGYNLK